MYTIRLERRNREGRVTGIIEKDFDYIYNTTLTRWLKAELTEAMYAKDKVTIENVTPQEDDR